VLVYTSVTHTSTRSRWIWLSLSGWITSPSTR